MSLLPAQVQYTDKDFDSLRSRLKALVQSVFPDWTDFDVASFGNVLLEMYAFVGDVLSFYQDNLARESRLITATQRKNVMALARMLGYQLHGARAATAEIELTLTRATGAEIVIPKGTVVRTQEVTEPIRFQLLTDAVISVGQRSITAIAEHSKPHTQRYDAKGLHDLEILLERRPYLDGSVEVSTASGAFTEAESFLNSGPNERHFTVIIDHNDRATLRFGNAISGLPPSGTLTINYKTGGGATGNIDAERLIVLEGAFRDTHGRPVQLSASNPQPASGGADRQSVASAKLLAPESLRALTRSVAREDFEINARRLPGVARALMLTSNEDGSIDENAGILYVIPQGGGLPTPALKNLALRQVTEIYPCTLTFQVQVLDPVYRPINITARLYIRAGQTASAVRDHVRANLATFFRISEPDGTPNPRVDFGFNLKDGFGNVAGEVAWSDIFNVVRDTLGVRKLSNDLLLNGQAVDVRLHAREFFTLGTITLIDGDTGGLL